MKNNFEKLNINFEKSIQIKENEIKNLKNNFERFIQEKENEIEKLDKKTNYSLLTEQNNILNDTILLLRNKIKFLENN